MAGWLGRRGRDSGWTVGARGRPGRRAGDRSRDPVCAGDISNKAAYGGRYWLWPVLSAFHLVALIGLQLGFQRGGALATAGSANLLLNAFADRGGGGPLP